LFSERRPRPRRLRRRIRLEAASPISSAKDGYTVSIVQEPETSLADDVAATNRILDRQSGPAVLVGHSYGGAVITEAGNNAHVASLVYVAAFAPDEGEKLGPLLGSIAPAANSIAPTADGYLLIDQAKFPADFAADLPAAEAQFMAISQVPINASILGYTDHRASLEDEAQLRHRRDAGPDDKPGPRALDVQTGRRQSDGNQGQPRGLLLAAARGCERHRAGCSQRPLKTPRMPAGRVMDIARPVANAVGYCIQRPTMVALGQPAFAPLAHWGTRRTAFGGDGMDPANLRIGRNSL
jgi:pimeloyl-ACP methyl ester carboxylesterase